MAEMLSAHFLCDNIGNSLARSFERPLHANVCFSPGYEYLALTMLTCGSSKFVTRGFSTFLEGAELTLSVRERRYPRKFCAEAQPRKGTMGAFLLLF